jgi:proteasome lid subunit RPN8/RPN11
MKVVIPGAILDAIARHGEETWPHECCGFLLGTAAEEAHTVREAPRQENARTESRENRFLITPDDFRRAERRARAAGLSLVGVYHSHPNSPPRPSAFDRDHAWPWYTYVIIEVNARRAGQCRAWRLRDDRTGYDPVAIVADGDGVEGARAWAR